MILISRGLPGIRHPVTGRKESGASKPVRCFDSAVCVRLKNMLFFLHGILFILEIGNDPVDILTGSGFGLIEKGP